MHCVKMKQARALDRSSMSDRYQCQRSKKGYGPIRVRVIFNGDPSSAPATKEVTPDPPASDSCRVLSNTMTSKRARSITTRLLQAQVLKHTNNQIATLEKALEKREEQLEETKKKLRSTQSMLSQSRDEQQSLNIKKQSAVGDLNLLCQDINKIFSRHFPKKRTQTKAKLLIDALTSGLLFHGEAIPLLDEMKRLYVRHIFKDWKVLKAFDCSAIGALKTSTIKALHSVLDEDKIGLFPSPSAIDRARQMLDKYAMEIVGCRREMTKYGEVYYLNFDRAIRLLLKATGLYEKAQRTSVSISFTADGALLLNSRTHVSCGVKITDVDGIHPVTKMPLTAIDEDNSEALYNCMQSRELCAILVMADAKDSKELYSEVFKDFYDYAERLRIHGMPMCDGEPALKPFAAAHPQDMKSTQTVSKRGGNCKMKHFFCHLCSCTKHNLTSYATEKSKYC